MNTPTGINYIYIYIDYNYIYKICYGCITVIIIIVQYSGVKYIIIINKTIIIIKLQVLYT